MPEQDYVTECNIQYQLVPCRICNKIFIGNDLGLIPSRADLPISSRSEINLKIVGSLFDGVCNKILIGNDLGLIPSRADRKISSRSEINLKLVRSLFDGVTKKLM